MSNKKCILITGANGFLGKKLIRKLITESYNVVAIVRNDKSKHNLIDEIGLDIRCITSDELFNTRYNISSVDTAVHLAFSRADKTEKEIASSIVYSKDIFQKFRDSGINNIVNISSQSVYGQIKEFRKENMPVSPTHIYGMAKYAVEVLMQAYFEDICNYTSLRLDNVIESQNLVRNLCIKAKNSSTIELVRGKQVFSYVSADDSVNAIISIINTREKWGKIYNVGHNRERYSLSEIAELVKNIALKIDNKTIKLSFGKDGNEVWSGMDTSEFIKTTGWAYKDNIYKMIENIYMMESCE